MLMAFHSSTRHGTIILDDSFRLLLGFTQMLLNCFIIVDRCGCLWLKPEHHINTSITTNGKEMWIARVVDNNRGYIESHLTTSFQLELLFIYYRFRLNDAFLCGRHDSIWRLFKKLTLPNGCCFLPFCSCLWHLLYCMTIMTGIHVRSISHLQAVSVT